MDFWPMSGASPGTRLAWWRWWLSRAPMADCRSWCWRFPERDPWFPSPMCFSCFAAITGSRLAFGRALALRQAAVQPGQQVPGHAVGLAGHLSEPADDHHPDAGAGQGGHLCGGLQDHCFADGSWSSWPPSRSSPPLAKRRHGTTGTGSAAPTEMPSRPRWSSAFRYALIIGLTASRSFVSGPARSRSQRILDSAG